ncbi:MAG: Holliday junction branch migration protein RuvA [Arenicella sp.]|nr:Holliday junction branch migration protein RuvA [Arenicella sp.]
MIAWLQGTLASKQPPTILLNVNGVGYELEAPMSTFYELPPVGEAVTLHVHMVVREDAQLLFAFHDLQQRELFRSLIRVNGVGPKVALAVLSTMTAGELLRCMADEDLAQLTRVPGIGTKTAQRLVVEMKDRLQKEFGDAPIEHDDQHAGRGNERQDAIAALVALGYRSGDAGRAVGGLPPELSSQEMIRKALRSLSGNVL